MDTQWLVCPLPHDKNDVHKPGAYRSRAWVYLNPSVPIWRDAQRWRWLKEGVQKVGACEMEFHVHLPPGWEGIKWDVDHATSNLLDTLKGILYEDDAVVTLETSSKTYDAPAGEGYVDIFCYPAVL